VLKILKKDISPKAFGIACLVLVLIKLWLVRAHLVMVTVTPHDDLLFIRQADSLLRGDWLGAYNQLTLIKEPFYPMFMALSNWLSLPLLFSQQLLYTFSCWVLIWAISPIVRQRSVLLAVFLFLLLNPGSFNYPAVGRIFQLAIYAPLANLIMGALLGMALRATGPLQNGLAWSFGLGIALTLFWITRDESIFIMPSIGLIMLFLLITVGGKNFRNWRRPALLCALPLVMMLTTTLVLSRINMAHYGVPAVNEITTDQFKAAYGGLLRIKSNEERQFIPVVRDVRKKAYAASPTFREVENHLDGPIGLGWQNLSGNTDIPAAFFIWAFRDSVAAAGYHESGSKALEFYQKMGDEIDGACASGQLDCRPRLTSLVPTWHQEYNKLVLPTVFEVLKKTVTFEGFNATTNQFKSAAPTEIVELFRDVTGETLLSSKPGREEIFPPYFTHLNKEKTRILSQIGGVYRLAIPFLFPLALLLLLWNLAVGVKRRRLSPMTVFSLSALGGVLSITAVMTLLTITSYSEIARVMHVSFPLVLLFIVSVFLDSMGMNRLPPAEQPKKRKGRHAASHNQPISR